MRLVRLSLPASALFIVALSIFLAMSLARADGNRVAEIVLMPSGPQGVPNAMTPGGSTDFTVRVLTHGAEVDVASISMAFEAADLEVVDALGAAGVQIQPHPASPFVGFETENVVDNAAGTIRYTAGSNVPTTDDFDLAIITLQAKAGPTPRGDPSQVVFLVSNGNDTAVVREGQQVLAATEDYPGAWISIGSPEFVVLPTGDPGMPSDLPLGAEADYVVRVLTHGATVDAASISMEFDSTRLQVVDAHVRDDVQIQPHPSSPFAGFEAENVVDNAAGTIRYTAGSTIPTADDFDFAIITFRGVGDFTPPGQPTEVVFLVRDGTDSALTRVGAQLLWATEDFVGASINIIVGRLVEIVMLPETTQQTPLLVDRGSQAAFTVRVLAGDREVDAASLVMTFDTAHLQVVDALGTPGLQIQPHPDSPFAGFEVENVVDNAVGTIFYTVGSNIPVSGDFNLAIITIDAQGGVTPVGGSTELTFLVDNGGETAATRSGQQLLSNTEDFVGAWVAVQEAGPPGEPFLVAPEDNEALNSGEVFFDWDDSTGDLDNYRLLVTSGDIENGPFAIDVVLNPASQYQVPPQDALADDSYMWQVTATSSKGLTADSVVRSFSVDREREWAASVDVSSSGVPGGVTLEFGVRPDATDGFDPGIDNFAVPPPPPPYVDGFFFYPLNNLGEQLLGKSFIPRGDSLEWDLVVKVAGAGASTAVQVDLVWDVSGVPDAFGDVVLLDDSGVVVADMEATGGTAVQLQTDFFGGASKLLTIRVSKFVSCTIDFKRVWNLISLCVVPPDVTPSAVLKDIGIFSIFAWDRVDQRYVIPTVMRPGEGYWVSVLDEATQEIQGAPVNSLIENVVKVWNLVGGLTSDAKVELVSGGPLSPPLFRWDSNLQRYVVVPLDDPNDPVLSGFGYWLAALGDATIGVGPAGP